MTAQPVKQTASTASVTRLYAAPSPVFPRTAPTSDNGPATAASKESSMVDISPAPPMRFAPIPLVSGTSLQGEDGQNVPIASVEMVITGEDGTTQTVTLEQRNGGWWVPRDQLGG